ncbi:hypothetical protein AAVH_31693, partial [Aphelenchoides avenae]
MVAKAYVKGHIPPEKLIVRFGSVYKNKMNISIKVTKKFSYPWSYKDILVLELAEDVRFDETVQPICLPLGYRERVGEIAIFAGFGKKELWGTEGAPDRKGRPPQREPSLTARENIIPLRK